MRQHVAWNPASVFQVRFKSVAACNCFSQLLRSSDCRSSNKNSIGAMSEHGGRVVFDPSYGPFASLKGSELWASIVKVVCNGVI